MEQIAPILCRGCLCDTTNPVSLRVAEIRDLFESCTRLKLPDQVTDARPQSLCSSCYKRCQEWFTFKTICHENEHIYWPLQNISRKSDHDDAMDGNVEVEQMHLQLDDDVEDLLSILGGPDEPESAADNGAIRVPITKTTAKIEIPVHEEAAELLSEIRDFIRNGETERNMDSEQCEDHTQSPQEVKTDKESTQSITNCDEDLTHERPNGDIKDEPQEVNGNVSPDCAFVDQPKEHHETLVVSDEENSFEIHAKAEFEDFDEDLLRKVELAEIKNEKFFQELTQSDPAKDTVEFWVCPACDANLLNSEAYRDHLEKHLAEDVQTKEQNRPAIQNNSSSSIQAQKLAAQCSRKRKADPDRDNSPPIKAATFGVGLILQRKKTSWNCPLCVECRSDQRLLADHLRRQHRLEETPFCPICPQNQAGTPISELMQHIFHIHVDKYKCQFCFEEFSTVDEFSKHISYVHNIHRIMKRFRGCPLCKETCRPCDFQRHLIRNHHVTGQASLNCPSCAAQYDNMEGLIKHITSYHSAQYVCTVCNDMFYIKSELNDHQKSHNADNEKKFACMVCHKQFKSRQALRSHKKSVAHKPPRI